mmetsp:Transcript_52301/g.144882  ORF Transcript_52301/g.144882 Transcript_52301/m.144882 type:complete len:201 (-) Transcript_52301:1280-1882(-)
MTSSALLSSALMSRSCRCNARLSVCRREISAADSSWISAAVAVASSHRRSSAPFSPSRRWTSSMCRLCRLTASAAASRNRRRTLSLSRLMVASSLATSARTTSEISCCISMLISATFFTSPARLPNSKAQCVSSRSLAREEHVMIRHVLELPPKLSASSRVSIESRYGTWRRPQLATCVRRWMTNARCINDLLMAPASRR